MNNNQFFIYLLIVSLSTYLIRAIPFALINKKIENNFIKSYLTYIPYTILASMTFPFGLYVTGNIYSGIFGLGVSLIVALKGKSLTVVALTACISALLLELLLMVIG